MTEHDPSPDRPTRDDADAADAREADATIDSFPADLRELQLQCRSLGQVIETGDPDAIERVATEVAQALQAARTTLEPANRRRPRTLTRTSRCVQPIRSSATCSAGHC